MAQLTAFGKEIKKRLVDVEQTQDWLIRQVRDRTGLFFDGSYLYKIMIGSRSSAVIVQSIREILKLSGEVK